MSILFDDMVFGPVHSRRLGLSLGINVLSRNRKVCTFNCIYCECGWTEAADGDRDDYHERTGIKSRLHFRLCELIQRAVTPDALTFAGNGEPTMHPEFSGIIDDVLDLRDRFFPQARVVVLSNSTTLGNSDIFEALMKVDPIMKLDAGSEEMFRLINRPMVKVQLDEIVANLRRFNGKLTIQTLMLKGEKKGEVFDNTSGEELEKYLCLLQMIKPDLVMLYPIDRPSPSGDIEKTPPAVIERVSDRIKQLGIAVKVYA